MSEPPLSYKKTHVSLILTRKGSVKTYSTYVVEGKGKYLVKIH